MFFLIALIAVFCCVSTVCAGFFDFISNGEPAEAEILESSFNWQTHTKVISADPGSGTNLSKFQPDKSSNAAFNTTRVNNVSGTVKMNLTKISDSQFKQLNESVRKNLGELEIEVGNDSVKTPLTFPDSLTNVSLEGKVLTVDFLDENIRPPILEGSGSSNVSDGKISFLVENKTPLVVNF